MTPVDFVPCWMFLDGPAGGERPVYPDLRGRVPRFVTVPEPVTKDSWCIYARLRALDPRPVEHVYQRFEVEDGYCAFGYVRTLEGGQVRVTCPRCGRSSANRGHVEHGYCARPGCRDWTGVGQFAILRAQAGVTLPYGVDGHVVLREYAMDLPGTWGPRADGWTAAGTGRFELTVANAYVEVVEVKRA